MYLVTGSFNIKNSRLEQARALMDKIVREGRAEEGAVRYVFYPDPLDPHRYFLFEEWETQAAHDRHFNGAVMQELAPQLFECLAEHPQVHYYAAEQVGSL